MSARVSACIVARDAAALLPDCIASVRECADEIVLVDSARSWVDAAPVMSDGARPSIFVQQDALLARYRPG